MITIYDELKRAYGNHFEDLFSELMKQKYGLRYQVISTSGRTGDMSVDGVLDYSVAFAVYAPEVYKEKNVICKLKSDFNGFMEKRKNGQWGSIKTYYFVIKRDRTGITPLVENLIISFNRHFPVWVMTMEDLKGMSEGYLPFSEDGYLLEKFKTDVTNIMEYIIDTDFSAEPFDVKLVDGISFILEKWKKKKYSFKNQDLEMLKKEIYMNLMELVQYFSLVYMHNIENGMLIFNNDSIEAGNRLRETLRPETFRIRNEIWKLLENLYSYKQL